MQQSGLNLGLSISTHGTLLSVDTLKTSFEIPHTAARLKADQSYGKGKSMNHRKVNGK